MTPAPTGPKLPARLDCRPVDNQGRMVPWFVDYADGNADHNTVRADAVRAAHELRWCFLCGLNLGHFGAFVLDPTRTVTRVAPMPPSHRTCAEYAAQARPFMMAPAMDHRDGVLHDGTGVIAVYVTEEWSRQRGRDLFGFNNPFHVTWWTEGRPATYLEALDALLSGLVLLREEAAKETNPEHAQRVLSAQYEKALACLPGNGNTQ